MGRRVGPKNKKHRESGLLDGLKGWAFFSSGFGWIARILRKSGVIVLFVLMGLLVYDFYRFGVTSERFAVELNVRGNNQVPKRVIRNTLKDVLVDEKGHRSLLTVSAQDVKRKLDRSIPRFRDIYVLRKFPNRLIVEVRERTPVALVARHKGEGQQRIFLPAGEEGVMFKARPGEREQLKNSLPVVLGLEDSSRDSEDYGRRWKRVMRVLDAYKKEFVIDMLNWIRVRPGGDVNVEIEKTKPLVVRLGLKRYRQKFKHLKEMMMTEQFRSVEDYVNLRDLDQILVN